MGNNELGSFNPCCKQFIIFNIKHLHWYASEINFKIQFNILYVWVVTLCRNVLEQLLFIFFYWNIGLHGSQK